MLLSLSINTTELQLFVDHSMFILFDLWIFVCATHLHMLWAINTPTLVCLWNRYLLNVFP